MTFKQAILASLERPALDALARQFQLVVTNEGAAETANDAGDEGDDSRREDANDDAIRDMLDRCPGLTFERLMGYLRKDALVEICRVVGISHTGTRRDLERRLIEFQQRPPRGMQ